MALAAAVKVKVKVKARLKVGAMVKVRDGALAENVLHDLIVESVERLDRCNTARERRTLVYT